jgi:hypothetical protein
VEILLAVGVSMLLILVDVLVMLLVVGLPGMRRESKP